MTLIPGEPDLPAFLKARASRLVQAQSYIETSWPDGSPREHAELFSRIQEWIENGGVPPWEQPPSTGRPYPPAPATTRARPL